MGVLVGLRLFGSGDGASWWTSTEEVRGSWGFFGASCYLSPSPDETCLYLYHSERTDSVAVLTPPGVLGSGTDRGLFD